MNFIVMGAGAVGCYVGGRLAAGGRRVTLVGRPRILDAITGSGLTVSDRDGFRAQVSGRQLTLATSLAAVRMRAPNIVLLCVKGRATESAALEIAACCPDGSSVISLQNGVDNVARIRAIAPRMRVMAGLVGYDVVMPAAAEVHRAGAGKLHVERSDVTQEMAVLLDACGLATEVVRDMRPLLWGKLLHNLNSPPNGLSDQPPRAQLMDRDYRRVLAALQLEALAVMRHAGIRPARLASIAPQLLPSVLRLPNWLFGLLGARLLRIDAASRPSVWDDMQHGRSTDIDDLCGAVVRLAARHGMVAPCNAAMCELVAAQRKGGRPLSGPELRRTAFPRSQ